MTKLKLVLEPRLLVGDSWYCFNPSANSIEFYRPDFPAIIFISYCCHEKEPVSGMQPAEIKLKTLMDSYIPIIKEFV